MRKLLSMLLLLSLGTFAVVSTAAAATSDTDVTIGGTATVPIPSALEPCTAGPGTATVTYNAVFHFTDLGENFDGAHIFDIASTMTGTFVIVPTSASGPTFTGHFTNNFQTQSTPPGRQFNTTTELIVVGTGSDGSQLTFIEIAHITSTPEGDIAVSFDTPRCVTQ